MGVAIMSVLVWGSEGGPSTVFLNRMRLLRGVGKVAKPFPDFHPHHRRGGLSRSAKSEEEDWACLGSDL